MNPSSFDAAVRVGCKNLHKDGFNDIHDGVMRDPVRIIGKPGYLPKFPVVTIEHEVIVAGSAVSLFK